MNNIPLTATTRLAITSVLGTMLLHGAAEDAAVPPALSVKARQRIEHALPDRATAQPLKPRRLLIFTRNQEYQGHAPAIAASCEAFTLMAKKTGAFETTVTDDPAVFERESLKRFNAVFLNNTIGNTFTNAQYRQNLLEFVTSGGGPMGVHGTSIAFMQWKWPPVEDWPEFGNMIGARGAAHPHANERIHFKIDEADHPLNRVFSGQGFEMTGEFFRFHQPFSRDRVHVLLSMDTTKTDLSSLKPGDPALRGDNDYAFAWVRNYGRGRAFYSTIGHGPEIFEDAKLLQFYLDATQFVLGDRILMVHLHDLHETGGNGHDVPWGTGIAKSEEFLSELHRLGAKPTMIGIEYAHDWHESMPKIAQCIEFFNATTLKLAADTPNATGQTP